MKSFTQFLGEGKMEDKVKNLIGEFAELHSTPKNLFGIRTSKRMWTRNDGKRFKEPSIIDPSHSSNKAKELFGSNEKAIQLFFNWLKNEKKAKVIPSGVSTAIGSGKDHGSTIRLGNIIFMIRNFGQMQFATTSILRNNTVWRK